MKKTTIFNGTDAPDYVLEREQKAEDLKETKKNNNTIFWVIICLVGAIILYKLLNTTEDDERE